MTRPVLLLISFFLLTLQSISQDIHGNRADYATYDPTGIYIAIAGDDLLLLNRNNDEVKLLNAYAPATTAASFSADGKFLAAQTVDFGIYIFDLTDIDKAPVFFQGIKKKAGVQNRLKFSPDNTLLATSNSEKLVIYNLKKGSEGKLLLSIPIASNNSHRTLAAFDVSDDWDIFFFNMQVIEVTLGDKPTFKYGRVLSWPRYRTYDSVISPDGSKVAVGDTLIGLASSGPHSNGYSLIRKILEVSEADVNEALEGQPLIEHLLAPTRIYVKSVLALLEEVDVSAISHITGGGFWENIPRVLPDDAKVVIDESSWQWPSIFNWLQEKGNVTQHEMYRTFNCGVGLVIVVDENVVEQALAILKAHGENAWLIGHIEAKDGEQQVEINS